MIVENIKWDDLLQVCSKLCSSVQTLLSLIIPFHPTPIHTSWFPGRLISRIPSQACRTQRQNINKFLGSQRLLGRKATVLFPWEVASAFAPFPSLYYMLWWCYGLEQSSLRSGKNLPVFCPCKPKNSIQLGEVCQGFPESGRVMKKYGVLFFNGDFNSLNILSGYVFTCTGTHASLQDWN